MCRIIFIIHPTNNVRRGSKFKFAGSLKAQLRLKLELELTYHFDYLWIVGVLLVVDFVFGGDGFGQLSSRASEFPDELITLAVSYFSVQTGHADTKSLHTDRRKNKKYIYSWRIKERKYVFSLSLSLSLSPPPPHTHTTTTTVKISCASKIM